MTIALACNYSRHLIELLSEQKLKIDFIKLSRADVMEEEMAESLKCARGLIHHLPVLGKKHDFWQNYDFDGLRQLITKSQTPYLSIHLDAYADELDELTNEHVLELLEKNYQLIKQQISIPLLVENCDRFPFEGGVISNRSRFECICQPEFISKFCNQVNADLLFDLAHARCAAHALGMEIKEYLLSLPLEGVKEIHLSGSRMAGDFRADTHYHLEELDYQLLTWVLEQTQPEIVTLEYGGTGKVYIRPETEKNNPAKLQEQLEKISLLLTKYVSASSIISKESVV